METGARAQLRVRADTIDRLVNEAGEVAIARARVEGELRSLKGNLLELTNSVIRLRTQMREIEIQAESQIQSQIALLQEHHGEFDPLEFDRYTRFQELTRSLAEGINDVSTVQQSLLKNLDDADAALLAQARLSREVQQRLFSIRTVPFGSLSERLYRILRATAKELDKRANLEIHGSQVELDRSVLEKLVGPLEHLLRNALDHGIESRDARSARRQIGDGRDRADGAPGRQRSRDRDRRRRQRHRLRARARTRRRAGLLAADAAADRSAARRVPVPARILDRVEGHADLRTRHRHGRRAQRDRARSAAASRSWRRQAPAPGSCSRCRSRSPSRRRCWCAPAARLWALPAPMVEQVQQVKSQALLDIYIQRKVEWQGRTYPFHYLPRLLGDTAHNPETKRYNSILLLRSGQNYAAIHVDEMVGNQEVVVKNIGPQLGAGVRHLRRDGARHRRDRADHQSGAARRTRRASEIRDASDDRAIGDRPRAPVAPISTQPLVMIVDDSLTVRKITSRLLQREGFAVATAKDGVDALQVLAEQMPDVILLDIEMPRMDGFEFTKTIKSDPKYEAIPIIMITSRTAEKHRNRAAELGRRYVPRQAVPGRGAAEALAGNDGRCDDKLEVSARPTPRWGCRAGDARLR